MASFERRFLKAALACRTQVVYSETLRVADLRFVELRQHGDDPDLKDIHPICPAAFFAIAEFFRDNAIQDEGDLDQRADSFGE